jgi:hypothetical protein
MLGHGQINRSRSPRLIPLVLMALGSGSACVVPPNDLPPAESPVMDLPYFLGRLHRLDHLPALEGSHTAMASTWDRTGGNKDGDDYKKLSGDRNILLDARGPGCVHRLFTGFVTPELEETRIQIYVDDMERPLFDLPLTEFFSGVDGPFPYPLMMVGKYAGTHFPIPFAERCLIQLVNEQPEKSWGPYWQIVYTSYPEGSDVRSLTWPPDRRARDELNKVLRTWLTAQHLPPDPPRRWTTVRTFSLSGGMSDEVPLAGCGVIRQLRVQVTPSSPELLRELRLTMRWDGADRPSVQVPLGYFFGHGDYGRGGKPLFNSMLLGVTEEEAYSRFPMPFAKGAVIRVENRGADQDLHAQVRLNLEVEERDRLPESWGRFHATWRQRAAADVASPRVGPQQIPAHLVLDRTGRGKYVGTLLHLDWPHLWAWWGEGDWLFWTDEQGWPPSYHGTGTEEYFNSGWTLFDRRAVSGYVKMRPGPVAVYSFHLNDSFSYEEKIRVMVETMGAFGGEEIIESDHPLWGSTAFWYASEVLPANSDVM